MKAARTDIVYCRMHIDLPSKDKTSKHLRKLMGDRAIQECKIENYPKFPGTYMTSFTFQLASNSNEEAVYLILKLCKNIANSNWTVNGPFEVPDLAFSCILNNTNSSEPLKWANVAIGDA